MQYITVRITGPTHPYLDTQVAAAAMLLGNARRGTGRNVLLYPIIRVQIQNTIIRILCMVLYIIHPPSVSCIIIPWVGIGGGRHVPAAARRPLRGVGGSAHRQPQTSDLEGSLRPPPPGLASQTCDLEGGTQRRVWGGQNDFHISPRIMT